MLISRFASLLVIFSLLSGGSASVFAQMPANLPPPPPPPRAAERDKISPELEKNALDLLEQAVTEAGALRLPENRAMIYAMAGDLFWTRDEKLARQLFRGAGNEILQAVNVKPEISSESQAFREANFGRMEIFNLRQMVLRVLAERDAEMALEILRATRAPDVAAEIQTYVMPAPPTPGAPRAQAMTPTGDLPRNFRVEQEIRLEQGLIAKAAEQDPQKAAQRVRESLEKGFSMEIIAALNRLSQKDAEAAEKLFGEVIQKLLAADLSKNQSNLNFAVALVRPYAYQPATPQQNQAGNSRESRLTIDDKSVRDIAAKIADALLRATNPNQASFFNVALPVLQKLVPERAALLKQKQAALKKQQPASPNRAMTDALDALNDPDATPEKLMAAAAQAPPQMRGSFYRQAVSRVSSAGNAAGGGGDPEKIRALLQSQPESRERDDAIARIDAALTMRHLRAGKSDEARRLIDRMPPGLARTEQIVQMAVASHRLNTREGKENALRLMEEARQSIRDFPETRDETDGLLRVAAGFAVIDPGRAFAMLAPAVELANEVLQAQAILARYNKQTQFFRDGEMIMSNSFGAMGGTVFRYGRELKMLAQVDFSRARAMIDQFRREDARVFAKLFVAQSILKERIGMEGGIIIG
jgi:hypothetical protein